MAVSKEQQHWDAWNLQRVQEGLVRDRRILTDAAVAEIRNIGLPHKSKLLDVGCGAGWTTEQLYRDFDYLGLDFGEQSIAAARIKVPTAQLQAVDFLEWNEPESVYDVILCVDTIACFRDQAPAMEKMRRALKPKGWLVMTSVNPFIYSRLSWVGPPGEGQARNWLTRMQFRQLVENHGFDVLRSRTIVPIGDNGWLRLVNARRVNKLMAMFTGQGYERFKEAIGLGQFRIITARKST